MVKIGIPRSLYYYYFNDLWINFFKLLGVSVVISPKTTKEIFNLGLSYSSDEMCVSMKEYIGHVAYLKDKCDYILVPRIDNYGRENQGCTNFLATYDIISNLVCKKVLNYNINELDKETEKKGLIDIAKKIGFDFKTANNAYELAKIKEEKIKKEKIFNNIKKLTSNKIKILLISHSYNTYSEFIGKPIIKMLEKLNVEVIYSDLFYTKDEYKLYAYELYFTYAKKSISSIELCKERIDGIVFLSSFPCGVDSLVNELVLRRITKPYINIVIDDLESMGGIETRIESFIDIINLKKVR